MNTPASHSPFDFPARVLRHLLLLILLASSIGFGGSGASGYAAGTLHYPLSHVDLVTADDVALVSFQDILRLAKRIDYGDGEDVPWLPATVPVHNPLISVSPPDAPVGISVASGPASPQSPRAPPLRS